MVKYIISVMITYDISMKPIRLDPMFKVMIVDSEKTVGEVAKMLYDAYGMMRKKQDALWIFPETLEKFTETIFPKTDRSLKIKDHKKYSKLSKYDSCEDAAEDAKKLDDDNLDSGPAHFRVRRIVVKDDDD